MSRTLHGALVSTYSVAAPISAGLAAPMPPRVAPPRILLGGSAPTTIASASVRRAASTIPAPMSRARISSELTSTSSYSSPISLARSSARRASSSRSGGSFASSGRVSGTSIT